MTAAVAEQQSGHDAYARFVETLFHELPRFAWRCQLRTFVYFLACWQLRTMRPGPAIVAISVETRRTLPASQHPAPRSVVAAVRRSLAPEDRELLVLRFDRGFNWREIALTSMKNHSNRKAWSVVLAVALASGVAACAVPADDSAGATEPGGADQTAAQQGDPDVFVAPPAPDDAAATTAVDPVEQAAAMFAASPPTISPATAIEDAVPGGSYSCASGNFCAGVWNPVIAKWRVFKLFTCRRYTVSNWIGNGFYLDVQTGHPATKLFGQNGAELNPPGDIFPGGGQKNIDWDPVFSIVNC